MAGYNVVPQWYTDPHRRYVMRWWDGTAWTEHVSTGDGQTYIDPVGAGAGPEFDPAPGDAPTYISGTPLGGSPFDSPSGHGAPPPPTYVGAPTYVPPGYGYRAPATPTPGIAVAALVCGLIGLALGLIPFIGFLGVPFVLAGIGCGIAGVVKGKRGAPGGGISWAGIVAGALGAVAIVIWTAILVAGWDDMDSDPRDGFCNEARFWQDPDC